MNKKTEISIIIIILILGSFYYLAPGYWITRANPDKTIILVLDDGTIGHYLNAYPLLVKYNYTASFAVIPGNIGMGGKLNWDMIEEMGNNKMDIISHTLNHRDLNSVFNYTLMSVQLEGAIYLLNKHGIKTDVMVLPNGIGELNPIFRLNVFKYYNYSRGIVYNINSTCYMPINLDGYFNRYDIPSLQIDNRVNLQQIQNILNNYTLQNKVIILTFHMVEDENKNYLTLPIDKFDSILKLLHDNNIKTITLTQFLEG